MVLKTTLKGEPLELCVCEVEKFDALNGAVKEIQQRHYHTFVKQFLHCSELNRESTSKDQSFSHVCAPTVPLVCGLIWMQLGQGH